LQDGTARCKRKTCPKLECKDTTLVPEIDPCCRRCRSDVESSLKRLSAPSSAGVAYQSSSSSSTGASGGSVKFVSASSLSKVDDNMQGDEPYRPSRTGKSLVREAKLRHRPSYPTWTTREDEMLDTSNFRKSRLR
jgi:hypothetical protein